MQSLVESTNDGEVFRNYNLAENTNWPFVLHGFSMIGKALPTIEGTNAELSLPLNNLPNRLTIETEANCMLYHPAELMVFFDGNQVHNANYNFKNNTRTLTINIPDNYSKPDLKISFKLTSKSKESDKTPSVSFKSVKLAYSSNDITLLKKQLESIQQENETLRQEVLKLKENQFNAPLFEAVKKGNLSRVKALVELGAEANTRNELGQTPLLVSLLNDFPYIAEFLVYNPTDTDNRAEVVSIDYKGNTILDNLAQEAASKHLQWLIDKYPKDKGCGFLQVAYRKIQTLNSEAHVLVKKILSDNILLTAVKQNNLPEVHAAVFEYDADINAQNNVKETALHKACHLNYEEIVQFLLQKGARTDLVDSYGYKACDVGNISSKMKDLIKHYELLGFIKEGNKEALEKELDSYNSEEINVQEHGYLLYVAIELPKSVTTRLEIIELLLNKVKNINESVNGTTALFKAIYFDQGFDNKELIKLIIKKGAQKEAKSSTGQTAIEYAFTINRFDIAIYLAERYETEKTKLKYSSCFFQKSSVSNTQTEVASKTEEESVSLTNNG